MSTDGGSNEQHEKYTPPADGHNTLGQFNPLVHGYNGLTMTSLTATPQPFDSRVLAASAELGGDFKFNLDINSGFPLGLGESSSQPLSRHFVDNFLSAD